MGAFSVCLMTALLGAGHSAPQDSTRKVKPVISWMGHDSKQAKAWFVRCERDEDWYAVCARHQGRESTGPPWCPQIDFDTCLVVALFGGEGSSPLGIYVCEIIEDKERMRLRYL